MLVPVPDLTGDAALAKVFLPGNGQKVSKKRQISSGPGGWADRHNRDNGLGNKANHPFCPVIRKRVINPLRGFRPPWGSVSMRRIIGQWVAGVSPGWLIHRDHIGELSELIAGDERHAFCSRMPRNERSAGTAGLSGCRKWKRPGWFPGLALAIGLLGQSALLWALGKPASTPPDAISFSNASRNATATM